MHKNDQIQRAQKMAAVTRAVFFLTLFLSISPLVLSFPFQATADSPQTTTDFLNYAPPVMKPPVDYQSITGLLPEPPISPTVGVPVESGKEPSVTVSAPSISAPTDVPTEGGNEPSETVGAPTVGAAPAEGGNEPSETVGAAPVEGGNEPSESIGAPTVGAAQVKGGNEPTEGSESSSISGGVEEQEPSDHGSPGLLAPSVSPTPSTPVVAVPVGGQNGPFGQRQRQQQPEGNVIGEEQDLGAQPLVDNTPFDSGNTKMGYFSLFGYAGVATVAFIGILV